MRVLGYQCMLLVQMLAAAKTAAAPEEDLDWWQKTVLYQIYPRSFKDSDGDGVGDLKGVEQKAEYLRDLGIDTVWLGPIFESPMVDFGYDISNYTRIDPIFGTIDDFRALRTKMSNYGMKLIVDFVPNHSSDQHPWFKLSASRVDPYTDYYVWRDAKGFDKGVPIPPNNWLQLVCGGPAWTYHPLRKQFFLHHFVRQQPDLNYQSSALKAEMKDAMRYWLDEGVDGFRVDAVPFLVEHPSFADEAPLDPAGDLTDYNNFNHNLTMDTDGTYQLIGELREFLDRYAQTNDKVTRLMITEAYTTLDHTLRYYGSSRQPGAHMPFNFRLLTDVTAETTAADLRDIIAGWLDNMPPGVWANWLVGNHDNRRVTSRLGSAELADPMAMLNTLLPGTAITFNGDELGMEDTFVRWDQSVDPLALAAGPLQYQAVTRDISRTPFHWDDSHNAGFSTANRTWLPVNPNYWWLNAKAQMEATDSHYRVFRDLLEARKTRTVQRGAWRITAPQKWIFVLERSLPGHPSFVLFINLGSEETEVQLKERFSIEPPSQTLTVYTTSANCLQKKGDVLRSEGSILLRPKAGIVLVTPTAPSPATVFKVSWSLVVATLLVTSCRFA